MTVFGLAASLVIIGLLLWLLTTGIAQSIGFGVMIIGVVCLLILLISALLHRGRGPRL